MNYFRRKGLRVFTSIPVIIALLTVQMWALSYSPTVYAAGNKPPTDFLNMAKGVDVGTYNFTGYTNPDLYATDTRYQTEMVDTKSNDQATILDAGHYSANNNNGMVHQNIYDNLKGMAQAPGRNHKSMYDHPIMDGFDAALQLEDSFQHNLLGQCAIQVSSQTRTETMPTYDTVICERSVEQQEDCQVYHDLEVERIDVWNLEFRVTRWDYSGDNEHCTIQVRRKDHGGVVQLDGHFDDEGSADNPLGIDEMDAASCTELLNYYIVNDYPLTGTTYKDQLINVLDIPPPVGSKPFNFPPSKLCGTVPCTDWNDLPYYATGYNVLKDDWYPQYCVNLIKEWEGSDCPGGEEELVKWEPNGETGEFESSLITMDMGVPIRMDAGPNNASGCVTLGSETVCHDEYLLNKLVDPPIAIMDKLGLQYSFKRPKCRAGQVGDQCGDTADDCRVVNSVCNAWYAPGKCLSVTEEYACDREISWEVEDKIEYMECNSEIYCLDGNCLTEPTEVGGGMAEVAAAFSAIQMMRNQEWDCRDPNDMYSCVIFKGEEAKCRHFPLNANNCCESPIATSAADYMQGISALNKMRQVEAIAALEEQILEGAAEYGEAAWNSLSPVTEVIKGGWSTISNQVSSYVPETVKQGYAYVADMFTSTDLATEAAQGAVNSAAGTATTEAAEEGLFALADELQQAMMEWMWGVLKDMFGQTAANLFIDNAATHATEELGKDVATDAAADAATSAATDGAAEAGASQFTAGLFLQALNVALLIYALVNIAMAIAYACDDEEPQVGMAIMQKRTHYIGVYCSNELLSGVCDTRKHAHCTFDTPLARIIVEEANRQLGRSWGTAEHPVCDGLNIQELQSLDWNLLQVTLEEEWIPILVEADIMPTIPDELLERITGTESMLSPNDDKPRMNASVRLDAKMGNQTSTNNADMSKEAMKEAYWGY